MFLLAHRFVVYLHRITRETIVKHCVNALTVIKFYRSVVQNKFLF